MLCGMSKKECLSCTGNEMDVSSLFEKHEDKTHDLRYRKLSHAPSSLASTFLFPPLPMEYQSQSLNIAYRESFNYLLHCDHVQKIGVQ